MLERGAGRLTNSTACAHVTLVIPCGARGGLTEWCRRELGAAGFEAVHAGFQGGDVRFQGVDALVELGK